MVCRRTSSFRRCARAFFSFLIGVLASRHAMAQPGSGLVIVKSGNTVAHEMPREASPVVARVQAGYGVNVTVPCGTEDAKWCRVSGRRWLGWIKTDELFYSTAMGQLTRYPRPDPEEGFAADIARAGGNDLVTTWLRLHLSSAQERSGRVDDAASTLETAAASATNSLLPFAYLALAKLRLRAGNVDAALNAYQELLRRFPGYTVQSNDCNDRPVPGWGTCGGALRIQDRIDATRTFLAIRQRSENTIAAAAASRLQKATAWYELGRAWEAKEAVDAASPREDGPIDHSEERRCYEAAVPLAPGSPVAGQAAWRLIEFSAPYEWEGRWEDKAKWSLEKFGGFVSAYPTHEFTSAALFAVAEATWVTAGYPEVYHYAFTPGDWNARRKELSTWFDTDGFGGGREQLPVQHPDQTPAARQLFQDIVNKYPHDRCAPLAAYYVAVIDDYCLKDTKRALIEYERFLAAYPDTKDTKVFAEKARMRVNSLRGVK
jgi:tetratricopeptide (TPR) repeat protein